MKTESMKILCVLADARQYETHTQQLAKHYLRDDTQNIYSIFNYTFTYIFIQRWYVCNVC